MKDFPDYSLKLHNTFGIDARCNRYVEFTSVEEAQEVAAILRSASRFLIIGGGSNLLLTQDFDGVVVHSACRGIRFDGESVCCGSGEVWDDVVATLIEHQLYGAENLSLIPGEVGASAVQNIGAYGVEASNLIDTVEAVEIATGQLRTFSNDECQYAYRQSRFKGEWFNRYLITAVTYRLSAHFSPKLDYGNIRAELEKLRIDSPTASQVRDVIIDIRQSKLPDPKVLGNAGSFFMNPVVDRSKFEELASRYPTMPHYYIDSQHEKIPAGWLIEQCGWKGRSMGRVGVHHRQALVLVNRGGATGREVVDLCEAIRNDVRQRFGIEINPEVNIV